MTDELASINHYFDHPLERRLAFREFGTCLGIKCAFSTSEDTGLCDLASGILGQWEQSGAATLRSGTLAEASLSLKPITRVMYAAAIIPGGRLFSSKRMCELANIMIAFRRDFL